MKTLTPKQNASQHKTHRIVGFSRIAGRWGETLHSRGTPEVCRAKIKTLRQPSIFRAVPEDLATESISLPSRRDIVTADRAD